MTLNDISGLEVPPAQNVQAVEPKLTEPNQQMPAESSFKAKFAMPLDKVKEYLAKNLPYQDYDLTYNLYVSQDEDKIKALQQMGPERYDERAAACETVQWDKNWLTDYRIYFSDMNGASGVTTNAGETAIDALRAGKTVRAADMRLFENNADLLTAISKGEIIPVTYILDGLDKNQKYYIAADVSVNFADQANPPAPGVNEWKRSKMSNIAGITTIGDEIVPKPGEKTPPAPVLSKESIGLSYATVFWNRVKDQKPEGSADDYGKLEYEIIRLTSSQMPPSLLDQRIPFDDIYNGSLLPNVEKKGFRTENEAAALGEYNGRTNTLIPAADTRYNWDGGDPLKLTDNTLRPNGLYFYYVRTVRVINGKELYSPWANISVTTDPVKAPINLKIEREGYAYDPIHQFVISFDAPIGSLDALGRDYGLQYQLKEEAGDWGAPVDMDVGRLKANAKEITINGQKYYHFVYTVSGLKYGTHYAVWVRMKDLRYTDYSAWSNIAETRTEMDNDEYDKDKETDDWLDYLKDKLDELFKNDYWILMDGQTFLYRPGMFGGVILKNPGAEIKLAEAGGRRAEYLIPQSALELMNAQNKGLGLTISGVGVTISPKAVTDGLQAVRAAKERINAKQDADYYLRVTLTSSVYTAPVDGKAPASPRVEAAFDIVCARKAAKALDTDIINAALNQLKSDAAFKAAADAIKQMIAQNRKAEDIIAYINNFISQNLKAFYPNAYNLYAAQADIAYPVYETETPVYVKFTPENASDQVKGHRWAASGWAAAVTQRQGAAAAIVTKLAGAYIFTSSAVNMPGLSDFPDSEALVGIISKYGLDDYLGKGGAFNADGDLSAYAVAGVCARLMGAGTTEDPFAFIREKGYAVSVRGTAQAATQQETVYHVMNVYEQKTKTKVSVMKITNYAAVNGINIDGRYVKSVLAANETGVFNPKGMKPAGKVTARQLLTMITNLNKKVKL
jgi:hypothetical protein